MKTTSPRYPLSNGQSEKFVGIVKSLMRKAHEDGRDIQLTFSFLFCLPPTLFSIGIDALNKTNLVHSYFAITSLFCFEKKPTSNLALSLCTASFTGNGVMKSNYCETIYLHIQHGTQCMQKQGQVCVEYNTKTLIL